MNLVLLVEDDENDIILTERRLLRSQLAVGRVEVARTLAEALSAMASSPDLVLLDLNLTDSRGLDTLRAVRPGCDCAVVVLTSLEDEKTAVEAIRLGAEDYLVKNDITDLSLRRSLSHALARSSVRRRADDVERRLGAASNLGE